jgi:hypothetical protein
VGSRLYWRHLTRLLRGSKGCVRIVFVWSGAARQGSNGSVRHDGEWIVPVWSGSSGVDGKRV